MQLELQRFLYHVRNDPGLVFYAQTRETGVWLPIQGSDAQSVTIDGIPCAIEELIAGVATYPSGEALCFFGAFERPPAGVMILTGPEYRDGTPGFEQKKVRNGLGGVTIWHGNSGSGFGNPQEHFSTHVRNSGAKRIRVFKFGQFERLLFTMSKEPRGAYYSPKQFREWYRVPSPTGWIAPGEVVCDPENYGRGRGVWAYFFESEAGDTFIGTAPLQRRAGFKAEA